MKKFSFSIILFAIVLSTVHCEECREAQPTCPDFNGTEELLTLLPVITDCSKYIMCVQGVAVERPCPGDLVFNRVDKVCDFASNGHCVPCEM